MRRDHRKKRTPDEDPKEAPEEDLAEQGWSILERRILRRSLRALRMRVWGM